MALFLLERAELGAVRLVFAARQKWQTIETAAVPKLRAQTLIDFGRRDLVSEQ